MDYLDRRGIGSVSMQDENPDAEAEWSAIARAKQTQVETFKDHPLTIGEIRSDKSGNAKDWTPREALIDMLRQIDNGLDVHGIIICYTVNEDDRRYTKYTTSVQAHHEALALLTRATWLVNEST